MNLDPEIKGPCMNMDMFKTEKAFNCWLKGKGEPYLISELEVFFAAKFKRIRNTSTLFGIPDHLFYSEDQRFLMIVDSAIKLNKKHLCKDLLYSLNGFTDYKIYVKAIFWIVFNRPSIKVIDILKNAFQKLTIDGCRVQFHIATIQTTTSSIFRLNLETSFGNRITKINNKNIEVVCNGSHEMLSLKSAAMAMGVPYTTIFNVLKRWKIEVVERKVSTKALSYIIQKIEKKATAETGLDFSGRFIPAYQKTENLLFPEEVNKILGLKGNVVRVGILAKWVTIAGSSPRGYRLLFDRNNVLDYKKESC